MPRMHSGGTLSGTQIPLLFGANTCQTTRQNNFITVADHYWHVNHILMGSIDKQSRHYSGAPETAPKRSLHQVCTSIKT
jgi:hypothetical protein